MPDPRPFAINRAWRILLADLGIHPANVLKAAKLPGDLLVREQATATVDEFYRLWDAVAAESSAGEFPLRLVEALSVDAFDAPIFAAIASPDLNTALERIRIFKPLIGPMRLDVDVETEGTRVTIHFPQGSAPPASLVQMEVLFFVQLARITTRQHIVPLEVTTPVPLQPGSRIVEFLGGKPRQDTLASVRFSALDARRPLLTADARMWSFFEPELRARMSELAENSTTAERVRAALLELLPSGRSSVADVGRSLGMSARTLQRRLTAEGETFQGALTLTRRQLAQHYLKHSELSASEISFLLGYGDPNSFFRAFHEWTGDTPERARASLRATA